MNKYIEIQQLLELKADYQARLNLIPYDGSPEIKTSGDKKYIYIRKRIGSKLTSTYVDLFSDDLYNKLLLDAKESRNLKKEIRHIEKKLVELGYIEIELEPKTILNLDFARRMMKEIIYDQAILEGVSTTFPQTEEIIENGKISGMTASDVHKILNLKHAWEFILDKDLLLYPTNFNVLSHIAKLVNEGFYENGGRIRCAPVTIGGSSYIPPYPIEDDVKNSIYNIISSTDDIYRKAINLSLYCMKKQIFIDGNKRAAVIFANHYLISNGAGLLIIPYNLVAEFKRLLVLYYEDRGNDIFTFLLEKCIKKL